jgi:hypothetical protein
VSTESFGFAVDPALRRWSRLFGIRAERCTVTLSQSELTVTFGRWTLSTPPANIVAVEVDGPYQPWKIAGPPRLSLSDLGITFATTARRGVCVELHDPVGALDPFHLIHHPNVTITVDEPGRFADELRRVVASAPGSNGVPTSTVTRHRGSIRHTLAALVRWHRRSAGSVTVAECPVVAIEQPPLRGSATEAVQTIDDGSGVGFHRRYRLAIDDATLTAAEAMSVVQADPHTLTSADFAPFNRIIGVAGEMHVGDRFIVELAGPWNGPVEVIDVTASSFRLATLSGHMEAGQIEFVATDTDDGVQFTIESWARSGNAGMDTLYDRVGIAQDLQSEMWVEACEAFATLAGSRHQLPPVEIYTEREDDTARSTNRHKSPR